MSPRDRTRAHLARLVAAAALTTGGGACSGGYGVVDPIPPPARCPDVMGLLRARARFVDRDGLRAIEIVVTAPADRPDVKFDPNAPNIDSAGGSIVERAGGADLTLVVTPQPGATRLTISAQLACTSDLQAPLTIVVVVPDADAGRSDEDLPVHLES